MTNYKEIAGIMKLYIMDSKLKAIVTDLANLFEREDRNQIARHPECECPKDSNFNKKDFLKECGVEE